MVYLKFIDVVEIVGLFLDDNGEMCGLLIILDLFDMVVVEVWVV